MKTKIVDGYGPACLKKKNYDDENCDCCPKSCEVLFSVGGSTLAERLLAAAKTVVDLTKLVHHRAVNKIVNFFF